MEWLDLRSKALLKLKGFNNLINFKFIRIGLEKSTICKRFF